jgi:hypothetical protein
VHNTRGGKTLCGGANAKWCFLWDFMPTVFAHSTQSERRCENENKQNSPLKFVTSNWSAAHFSLGNFIVINGAVLFHIAVDKKLYLVS